MANKKLHKAKTGKNDEFYTRFNDIQNEINAYIEFNPDVFRDKVILLPCDDPEWSNFTKFFAQNFEKFGLKKLISTSYAYDSKSIKAPYQLSLFESESPRFDKNKTKANGKIFSLDRDLNKSGKIDIEDLEWDYLDGDGDFRSDEVKKLRNEADIIITNPPFSLFREFVTWIIEGQKNFLIIGNINCISYKEIFSLLKDNKMWVGYNKSKKGNTMFFEIPEGMTHSSEIIMPDGKRCAQISAWWFTNLEHGRRHQPLRLMTMEDNKKYSRHKEIRGHDYVKYETFDAIDVPNTDAIPRNYKGIMGVPKSFLESYNPDQFEILGYEREDDLVKIGIRNLPEQFLKKYRENGGTGHITKGMKLLCYYDYNGVPKVPFSRILIRYTQEWIASHPEDFE